jgi:hypothetical protein
MAAALAIEALFRPTNRLRDQRREERGNDSYQLPNDRTEVELLPGLSPEHILATGITWEYFCRFVGREKFVWMGPSVYVSNGSIDHLGYRLVVELGSMNRCLRVYAATEPQTAAAATTATCDFVVRLLATITEDNGAFIGGRGRFNSAPISGPGLFRFFQESQGTLRQFTLKNMALNEEQIGALATTEFRPDMEVVLYYCSLFGDNGCHEAFVECLHRDRGPTELDCCVIGYRVLAAALEGNSRVTRLRLGYDPMLQHRMLEWVRFLGPWLKTRVYWSWTCTAVPSATQTGRSCASL